MALIQVTYLAWKIVFKGCATANDVDIQPWLFMEV